MGSIGEILYNLRRKTGLTIQQMSALTNVSTNTIEAYESNYATPDLNFLMRVADIFGVSYKFVAGMTQTPQTHEDPYVCEVYVVNNLDGNGIPRIDAVVGTAYMSRKEMHGSDHYAFIAPDDAMTNARIQKGDLLIVRAQNHADNNDIVIATCDDGPAVVRRYHREGYNVILTSETLKPGFDAIKVNIRETKLMISGVVKEVRMKL